MSQDQSKHSALPWQVNSVNGFLFVEPCADDDNSYICRVEPDRPVSENRANAAFIVEAVNNHNRLKRENAKMRKVLKILADRAASRLDVTDQVTGKTFYELVKDVTDQVTGKTFYELEEANKKLKADLEEALGCLKRLVDYSNKWSVPCPGDFKHEAQVILVKSQMKKELS